MATKAKEIEIKQFNLITALFPIQGKTELIVHRWSEKAKKEMLDKQTGKATPKKPVKDPNEDYEASLYRFADGSGFGFPAVAFKAAIVGACRSFDKNTVNMTLARQAVKVNGDGLDADHMELVRIVGEPHIREDMVRIGMGTADIRYRAGFLPWSAVLSITYNSGIISTELMANLVNAAGFGGVGEWRPEKADTGWAGVFELQR